MLILDASCFSSVSLELKRIVIRYSNARPFPVIPTLSKIMKYVDLNQYDLERFESEKRTEEKEKN